MVSAGGRHFEGMTRLRLAAYIGQILGNSGLDCSQSAAATGTARKLPRAVQVTHDIDKLAGKTDTLAAQQGRFASRRDGYHGETGQLRRAAIRAGSRPGTRRNAPESASSP